MAGFEAKSICILGRLPALSLAELESIFTHEHIMPFGGHALVDIPAEEIDFDRLGGTIKTAKILSEYPGDNFSNILNYLAGMIPGYVKGLPPGKFTLGISAYGLKVGFRELNKAALAIKRTIKPHRPVRIVPNKSLQLSSAQVIHNKLTRTGGLELMLVSDGNKTYLAQTMFVQDIEAYAARDQARPARDPKVGMLSPKLAQTIINLAAPLKPTDAKRVRILDPFCGTGVILQEALMMGYSVIGTDNSPRMVDFSRQNIQWLFKNNPGLNGEVVIELGDANYYRWPGFSAVASETYLGPPLSKLPNKLVLEGIINDVDRNVRKFLKNLGSQKYSKNQILCLALPAWLRIDGSLIDLPIIDHLTDVGYTYLDLKYVRREELVYFRENQIVARRLVRMRKV